MTDFLHSLAIIKLSSQLLNITNSSFRFISIWEVKKEIWSIKPDVKTRIKYLSNHWWIFSIIIILKNLKHKSKCRLNGLFSKTNVCNSRYLHIALICDLAINLKNRIHPRGKGMPKNPYAKKVHLAHQHVVHVLVL